MQVYEIRLLKDNLSTTAIIAQQYFDDHAAVRAAQRFAQGRRFEVWRGMNCIYGAYPDTREWLGPTDMLRGSLGP